VSVQLTPILTKFWDAPESWSLKTYEDNEGYQALKQAFGMSQTALVDMAKDSGLRGRGGAGFPTGLKWSFLPPPDGGPRYLVVNADESEPGTCKDIPLMMAAPHFLIEGVAITSFAIGCNHAFIYIRGEVVHVYRRLLHAVEEAYAAGFLGKNILGSGFDLEVTVHAGAGAYICGEETALLDSLEGRRGQPRLKPPFPAVAGLYARPTVVNNVESIASIPPILLHGADWFKDMGTDKSTGFGIFSLSGHVKRPGQFEAPLGITLRELLDMAGGMRDPQHPLKFWTPGGSSTPLFTDEHLDVPLDFEAVAAAGSMLGTRALQIFDDTTCVVRATERWTDFYKHESCGKCTPCREGTWWLAQILERLEHGQGDEQDIEKLVDICDNILGRSFCALGDGATSPITSSVEYFRDEYLEHLRLGRCPFDRDASTVFATGSATASSDVKEPASA
jgi:NADH-quinone oxidoreductase subunit F